MLMSLTLEGLATIRRIGITVGISRYFSNLVSGTATVEERDLIEACVSSSIKFSDASPMLPAFEAIVKELMPSYPAFKETEIFAYLLIQVTKHAAA